MPSTAVSTQTATRFRSALRLLARALEVSAWTFFFAAALTVLALRHAVLPRLEHERERLAQRVSEAIGLQVTIGALQAHWRGLRPQLLLADVRVHDRAGREAFVLPAAEAVLSWRSMLAGGLRLHRLALAGPRLELRRDAEGRVHVAGLPLGEGTGGGFADWLLAQREIEIRDAEIEWRDERRGAPPLVLSGLQFRLRNDGTQRQLGLDARPPRALGSGLALRAEFAGDTLEELRLGNGRAYVELGETTLAGWRTWVDYPVDVRSGVGALRLWVTLLAGKVVQATADVALTGVAARFAADLPVLELRSVQGRVHGRELPLGFEFGVRGLGFAAADGTEMQAGSFRLRWERAEAGRPARGAFESERVQLGPLAQLAAFVPFPHDLRRTLEALSPAGEMLDVKFDWTGELPQAARFAGRARFSGLALRPWGAIPGFAGFSGSVEASEAGGALHLASTRSELELAAILPQPRLSLSSLTGELHWERRPGGAAHLRIAKLAFANEDVAGSAFGTYTWSGSGPGVADLSATLARVEGRSLAKYLPLATIMGEGPRDWLATAILQGRASDVRVRLRGDLRDFPFADPARGQFQVSAQVQGGVLEYADGWPRIEAIDGVLRFERARMEFVARSATVLGARLSGVRTAIPDLAAQAPVLRATGEASGPSAEFLRFLRSTPLRDALTPMAGALHASGGGQLQLRLEIPLAEPERIRVAGEYRFANNSVVLDERLPPLERASGRIGFSNTGFAVSQVRGQMLGGPVTLSGGSQSDADLVFVAEGTLAAEALGALAETPLRGRLSGRAPYRATLAAKGPQLSVTIESPLRGVAIALPPPLAKTADEPLALRLEVVAAQERERVSLVLGRLLAAELLGERRGGELALQRAAVWLSPPAGERPRLPERRDVTVTGSLAALDLDRWAALFPAGGATLERPLTFDLRVGALDVHGKRLRNVALRGAWEAGGWSTRIASAELAGTLAWRGEGGGRLVARLAQLAVPEDAPGAMRGGAEVRYPALDLIAESFVHRDVALGRLEIVAQPEEAAWRIERLVLTNAEAALRASGHWGGGRTKLRVAFVSPDLGRLLERLGLPERIDNGSARIEGELEWSDAPFAPDLASLSGELTLRIEKGEFPKVDVGVGRVLSLLSLQLSDVFAKGFPFDAMTASLRVRKGVVSTEDLQIGGSAAQVSVRGEVDLARETQRLNLRVVPAMRRGVTALATLVNPSVAVGVALAQSILKDPLGQLLAYEYSVSGRWTDPQVERIAAPPPRDPASTAGQ